MEIKLESFVDMNHKKYVVFVEGGRAPTVYHDTLDEALEEQARLSKLIQGKEAVVAQCLSRAKSITAVVRYIEPGQPNGI